MKETRLSDATQWYYILFYSTRYIAHRQRCLPAKGYRINMTSSIPSTPPSRQYVQSSSHRIVASAIILIVPQRYSKIRAIQ